MIFEMRSKLAYFRYAVPTQLAEVLMSATKKFNFGMVYVNKARYMESVG